MPKKIKKTKRRTVLNKWEIAIEPVILTDSESKELFQKIIEILEESDGKK